MILFNFAERTLSLQLEDLYRNFILVESGLNGGCGNSGLIVWPIFELAVGVYSTPFIAVAVQMQPKKLGGNQKWYF